MCVPSMFNAFVATMICYVWYGTSMVIVCVPMCTELLGCGVCGMGKCGYYVHSLLVCRCVAWHMYKYDCDSMYT